MRSLIILSILILLSGAGYIGFSMLSYEPETVRGYNIKSLTDAKKEYTEEEKKELSDVSKKKKTAIVALLRPAIDKYNVNWENFPQQVSNISFSILNAVKSGALPTFYPVTNYKPSLDQLVYGQDYSVLEMVSEAVSQVPETADENETSAAVCPSGIEGFILGDTGRNKLSCTSDTGLSTRIYLGGPDNDIITARGNAIINGGSGNDVIKAGPEFTMIFVEPNFGTDTIDVDCDTASPNIQGSKVNTIPWRYKFTHFIVFDSRIAKDRIVVSENSIENKVTGDKILLKNNCFNIVFLSDE